MSLEKYLGKVASELPIEVVENLLSEGYSISPRSGRIRKRVVYGRKRSLFSKRSMQKYGRKTALILLAILLLASLIMVVSQLDLQKPSPKKNSSRMY